MYLNCRPEKNVCKPRAIFMSFTRFVQLKGLCVWWSFGDSRATMRETRIPPAACVRSINKFSNQVRPSAVSSRASHEFKVRTQLNHKSVIDNYNHYAANWNTVYGQSHFFFFGELLEWNIKPTHATHMHTMHECDHSRIWSILGASARTFLSVNLNGLAFKQKHKVAFWKVVTFQSNNR